jgi:hypothetical protein
MKRDRVARLRPGLPFSILATAILVLAEAVTVVMSGPAGAVAPPSLTITPGPYHNLQLINLSVGPNHYFTPYSRINIIECADPGGKAKNLPISVDTCDGNTIQGVTILVARNGSWYEHGYQLYALPNFSQLGESPDSQPVCNQKKSCVLYIGQNQEKFTAPKMFSAPFVILKSGKHS